MFAAVEKLYCDGKKYPPQWPPMMGQLRTYRDERVGRHCLKLWPLDWLESAPPQWEPVSVLWLPEFVAFGHSFLLLRGLEEVRHRLGRTWVFQKWRCEIMERERAMSFIQPDRRYGEVPGRAGSAVPSSPSGSDGA